MKWIAYCFILFIPFAKLNEFSPLEQSIFIITSQPDQYHFKLTIEAKKNLREALDRHSLNSVSILTVGIDFPDHGAWTIFPIITRLNSYMNSKISWCIFLKPSSRVNLQNLSKLLKNHADDHFIGHALQDSQHTIIHHFRDPKSLEYPAESTGFILSSALVKDVAVSLSEHGATLDWFPKDFSIDAQYEFAFALKNRDERHVIKHSPQICLSHEEHCAIFQASEINDCNATEESVKKLSKETLVAVKTCGKYHEDRLPVIQKTWAVAAPNVMYFSEKAEIKWGTQTLKGVENTEKGHCQKTMAIIEFFHQNAGKEKWKWLVIADDDTILSVQKLVEFLHCFDPDENIHLGQKYGYRVALGTHGYDYVTGGGGMIFSRKLVDLIIQSGRCSCPRPDDPDDMHLGICMSNLGLKIVHSPRFHQARPEDYPLELLKSQDPISFHKFWNTDPIKMYQDWFSQADLNLKNFKYNLENRHQEL